MAQEPPPVRRVSLPPLHEFRFELEPTEALSVTLVNGTAEVFGFELVPGLPHPFGDEVRAAIWSSDGAELEIMHVAGRAETSYVASESTFSAFLALHLSLARLRLLSRQSSYSISGANQDLSLPDDEVRGPRVMVVGERGSGKTSLVKTLANWRVRECTAKSLQAGGVTLVNLDVSEGGMTMPGTLSITKIGSPLSTTTTTATLGTTVSSGPPVPFPPSTSEDWQPAASIDAYAAPVNPLVFWHGHTASTVNSALYDTLLKRAAKSLKRKLDEGGVEGWKAGAIVDTPGEWAEKKGMAIVGRAVRELEVNILVVLGSERLYVEMKRLLATNKTVTVVRVPKNDGASEPDLTYQNKVRDQQIKSHFYGGPSLTQGVLSPFSIKVKFSDLRVSRVGEAQEAQAPSSALPIGFSRSVADTELLAIDLEGPRAVAELTHRILAVPQAADGAPDEEVVLSPVLGFVYVSSVDQAKKMVTLLSPLPGRLPRKHLLVGSLDWQDS